VACCSNMDLRQVQSSAILRDAAEIREPVHR
jgi:hypothetical protein